MTTGSELSHLYLVFLILESDLPMCPIAEGLVPRAAVTAERVVLARRTLGHLLIEQLDAAGDGLGAIP